MAYPNQHSKPKTRQSPLRTTTPRSAKRAIAYPSDYLLRIFTHPVPPVHYGQRKNFSLLRKSPLPIFCDITPTWADKSETFMANWHSAEENDGEWGQAGVLPVESRG
jgi:hypothetical protein